MNFTLPRPLFFLLLFTVSGLCAQTITVTVKATIPSVLTESSGLLANNRNKIWSHNDSGGQPQLYQFDSTGILTKTLTISNATNVDWEELTSDSLGNVYIGDFGNNNNDRKDLKIYKISNPDLISGNTATPQVINFHYPDQNAFPPVDAKWNYDMEAFIHYEGVLYLFSKNRTNPYNGFTKLYRLPDVAGTYTAELLDSFYIGPGPLNSSSITSADISPDHSTLVLISHEMLFLFTHFTGHQFFKGSFQSFTMSGTATHKEGVCFTSNTRLYITDERSGSTGGKLYDCNIQPYLLTTNIVEEQPSFINLYPNPCNGLFTIEGKAPINSVEIFNALGEKIYTVQKSEYYSLQIDLSAYPKGIYLVGILTNGEEEMRKVILQ